ncbi:TonB-dependent receptor [Yunchengibacter salinarum]|uniref:TonB-dependent receptor n=1 Tax=Yunchengibacter salinarum TaxID=3133399 RepID=UPI0035B5DF0D
MVALFRPIQLAVGALGVLGSGALCPPPAALGSVETIPVTGTPIRSATDQGSSVRIDRSGFAAVRPRSMGDALALAPAALVQTNSRGQTLLFLRGTGERQVAAYFDGAPINVPWDNRLDLSRVPVAGLAGMRVTSGPVSVLYGANTTGGAVELLPDAPALSANGLESGRFLAERGSGGAFLTRGGLTARAGAVGLTLAGSYRRQNGMPLPDGVDLPFTPEAGGLRFNTDRERAGGLARLQLTDADWGRFAASYLLVDRDRGVAPEGDRPPDEARFWRLPRDRQAIWVLSHGLDRGDWRVKTALWRQVAEQTTLSFDGPDLAVLDTRQQDRDRSLGGRIIAGLETDRWSLDASLSALHSRHRRVETPPGGEEVFTHWLVSAGLEAARDIGAHWRLSAGVVIDSLNPTATAGRPGGDAFSEPGGTLSLAWRPDGPWSVKLGLATKARMPTMRELFSAALDRFLLNPDLKAERVNQIELVARYESRDLRVDLIPFLALTDDTIDQRFVRRDGRLLRQRVNLSGSRVAGVTIDGRWQPATFASIQGHMTWMAPRRDTLTAAGSRKLVERPDWLGRVDATIRPHERLELALGVQVRGRAFSPDRFGTLQPLPWAVTLDMAARWTPGAGPATLYLRADNLFDKLVLPQSGLPAAGRVVRAGLDFGF